MYLAVLLGGEGGGVEYCALGSDAAHCGARLAT